jgi:hypothetical protein
VYSVRRLPTFLGNVPAESSGWKYKPVSRQQAELAARRRFGSGVIGSLWAPSQAYVRTTFSTRCSLCLLRSLFDPEDEGSTFLRNVCGLVSDFTVLHTRR